MNPFQPPPIFAPMLEETPCTIFSSLDRHPLIFHSYRTILFFRSISAR